MMRLPLAAGRGPLADLSQRPAKVSWIPWDFFGGKTHRKSQVEQVIYTYYIYIYLHIWRFQCEIYIIHILHIGAFRITI